jgi:hypothetical protein
MMKSFSYGAWNSATRTDAFVGKPITFEETREYVLHLTPAVSSLARQRFLELGGRFASPDIANISFTNQVGRTEIFGVPVEVESSKISSENVAFLLQEVSDLSASLIFSWKTPVSFEAGTSILSMSPVPYHQFQFLRHSMLRTPVGGRLQDFISAVERNPIRRFDVNRPIVPVQRVRRLDTNSLRTIFSRMDRLAILSEASHLAGNNLAQSLTFGDPARSHFPTKIAAPSRTLSYDSPENRFIKHVLKEALSLTYRFSSHRRLHATVRDESLKMQSILESLMESPVLLDAGSLTSFSGPTQALSKADGYRDVFLFWQEFSRHISLPLEQAETARLLEGRDLAKLYEYWVFLRILDAVVRGAAVQKPKRVTIRRSELGESLGNALLVNVTDTISVEFNPSYSRGSRQSYSTTLRPDVVITVGTKRFAFDAKYKLDYLDVSDEDSAEDSPRGTYKQADLHKMHTYRDAISSLQSAIAVYPGSEFVFFNREGNRTVRAIDTTALDGIGALPLCPHDLGSYTGLDEIVGRCLTL